MCIAEVLWLCISMGCGRSASSEVAVCKRSLMITLPDNAQNGGGHLMHRALSVH